jgi:hypothetical protein
MMRLPKYLLASLGFVMLAALGPLGCNGDNVNAEGGESCDLLAGDLVITEIVANVEGPDDALEWIEIYNASSNAIDLEGRTLIYSKVDGTGRKGHTITRSLEVPPGGYVTLGAMLDEIALTTDYLDYGYGQDLGDFGNSGGYLAIECGEDVVDEVYYEAVVDTASRVFDGSQVPDATANDSVANWCDSKTEQLPGFAATPRAANDVCGSQTGCVIGEQSVPVVRPGPGDLVITEVLPDPDAVGDDFGEWFEIHSLASAEFHLNGVEIGRSLDNPADETIADAECIVIAPGSYAVVANNADNMTNGGIPFASIVWQTSIALTNGDGSLWLAADGAVLDAVTWSSPGAGNSTQLDPDFSDPTANDELGNWCDAELAYGAGDLGTPGAENMQCPVAPVEGQCDDGGQMRMIDAPMDGELIISEITPNPSLGEPGAEWIELYASADLDLNGLELYHGGDLGHTVESGTCIEVAAGSYVVLARSDVPVDNCGLPAVDYVYTGLSLTNSNSNLELYHSGALLDGHNWTATTEGVALSYDMTSMTWCEANAPFGCGDLGTPGAVNSICGGCMDPDTNMDRLIDPPAPGELILSEIMPNPSLTEPGAEWFEIYATADFDLNGLEFHNGGALEHTVASGMCIEASAGSYLVLARSDVALENCDLPVVDYLYDGLSMSNTDSDLQIFSEGMVIDEYAWTTTTNGVALSYDMLGMSWCEAVDAFGCGDLGVPGAANPACGGGGMDGMCFDGMAWRDIVVPSPGQLVISEFMANPSLVPDTDGEWFEIRALADFDLNGLELGKLYTDGPLETVDAADCIPLVAGGTALLANNADTMTNGGLPVVDHEVSFSLTNASSALHVAAAGVLLDEITWTAVADGQSTSLDPDNYDPDVNDMANNDGVIWCFSSGTPKADNGQCN